MDLIGIGLLVLGVVAGTLSAATGVGMGLIVVPTLLLIPALTPQQAVAISILAYLFNSLVASIQNVRGGLIVWNYAAWLIVGGALGALVGTQLLTNISALTLKRIVGVLVVGAGVSILANR